MKAIISLLFIFAPSIMFGVEEDLMKCVIKQDDVERLKCYDILASSVDSEKKMSNSPEMGKWLVEKKNNPIDDTQTATAVLFAESGKSKWGRPIALIVRCMSNKTELYINWNDYLGNTARVLTRIDDQKAVTKQWSLSTNKQSSFYPRGTISFLKEIESSNKLVAQTTPYNENPITAIFDIRGSKKALQPIRKYCNW